MPKLLATDAFVIFVVVQFFRGVPRELTEAACTNDTGHVGTSWQIVLPLPALATTAIFTFTGPGTTSSAS
ncbi:hypothetical protein EIL87_05045 [Saccharopolyspora rhizosphaerae]|uniref:Uncharacterized protein n=1 Tax=Saccharopolyspora rhizosphaerae TaxID=2492662 RepID=A0A3R8P2W6_9PSEU|nr:hypothetical protein [Saccharopolyspora rhizosphaerae]RRO18880.1 hypothetical protein EIL87_05045 [Saccharopolyspora rhizosphaerae]